MVQATRKLQMAVALHVALYHREIFKCTPKQTHVIISYPIMIAKENKQHAKDVRTGTSLDFARARPHPEGALQEEDQAAGECRALAQDCECILAWHVARIHRHLQHLHDVVLINSHVLPRVQHSCHNAC